jgi:hypothetical protein
MLVILRRDIKITAFRDGKLGGGVNIIALAKHGR